MKRKRVQELGKSAIEIAEEAVHLLRLSPIRVLALYYVGTLPFMLGLLYFWADMSHGAFAYRHCAEAALGVSMLFLWMKSWQTAFARELWALVTGTPSARWTFRRVARAVAVQTAIQPSLLLALPIALLILLPFGWVYAFYHNVTVFGDGETGEIKAVFRRSQQQALLWQRQNHVVILILFLFGLFVFLNLHRTFAYLPGLVRSLLGIETTLSRGGVHPFNTALLATAWVATYLCINPITNAVYVLRCFYGESLSTGADLSAELRSLTAHKRTAVAALALLIGLCVVAVSLPATADSVGSQQNARSETVCVSASDLDRTITKVLEQPEYAWRMPREKPPENETQGGWFRQFILAIDRILVRWGEAIGDVWRRMLSWILKQIARWLPEPRLERPSGGFDWVTSVRVLAIVLLTVAVVALVILLVEAFLLRRTRRTVVAAEPIALAADITDESLAANELPEDTWIRMAVELIEKGELRLALRAFYLATLAHLAQRELITIAKFKSNREYERELRRRAHSLPEMVSSFAQNVTTFDRAWYGMYQVTQDILSRFRANLERIKTRVEG